jgi:hypothetical protein
VPEGCFTLVGGMLRLVIAVGVAGCLEPHRLLAAVFTALAIGLVVYGIIVVPPSPAASGSADQAAMLIPAMIELESHATGPSDAEMDKAADSPPPAHSRSAHSLHR